jgi:hypothetical protein
VLWLPFIFFLLMLITDASLAFFSKAQAFRTIETGNRAFATSLLATTDDTASWIEDEFAYLSPSAEAATATNVSEGLVSSSLQYPASEVVLFNTLNVLSGWEITVTAQQYVERAL